MKQPVTVDFALRRGFLSITLPIILMNIAMAGGLLFLVESKSYGIWMIVGFFPTVFALTWIYWSFAITHWRIWAFAKVRNVHELERRAIKSKLIGPAGHWGERTEIRTASQKKKLEEIDSKFAQDDVFTSDKAIPTETKVHVSKPAKIFLLALFGTILVFCCLYWTTQPIVASLFALLCLWMIYDSGKSLMTRGPRLILSETGITLENAEFYPWKTIWNEDVVSQGNSNASLQFYDENNTFVSQRVDELSLSPGKIEKLLREYRGRYENGDKYDIVVSVARHRF